MIQIINGIKIKTSTIDEAINLIFKKKKRYRELFLINSLTMNMIERLLLINELIIQKALEDLNVLKIEQKPIHSNNIHLKTHPLHQVKEDIEININLSIMSNVYTRYIRRINNDIKSAEERCDLILFPKRIKEDFILGTVLTSDIGFKVMKDIFKEELEEYKYIEAQETITNNTEKKERQQNWIKTLVNDDNEFCVEGVTVNLLSYKQNITHSKSLKDDENMIIKESMEKVNSFLSKNKNAKKIMLDKFFIKYKMQNFKEYNENYIEEEKKDFLMKTQTQLLTNALSIDDKKLLNKIKKIIDKFYITKLKEENINKSLLSYFEETFIKYRMEEQ